MKQRKWEIFTDATGHGAAFNTVDKKWVGIRPASIGSIKLQKPTPRFWRMTVDITPAEIADITELGLLRGVKVTRQGY